MRVSSGQTVLNAAMDREFGITSGRVVIAFDVCGRETYPPHDAVRLEAGLAGLLQYRWQDPGRWRVTLSDPEGVPRRELVCDGAWIDSGDALWPARFASGGAPAEETAFREAIWPWQVVAEFLFPLTFGRTLSTWPGMTVELVGEEMTPDGDRLIRLEHWPSPALAFSEYRTRILAFIDPHLPWDRLDVETGPTQRSMRRRHSYLLTLDAFRGYMPVRWSAGGKRTSTGPFASWEDAVDLGDDLFMPTAHRWSPGGGDLEPVATARLLVDRCAFHEPQPADLFRIAETPDKPRMAEAVVEGA